MSNKKTAGRGVLLGARLVYGACWLVGKLPHWFLYHPLADFVFFLLYRVVRYRRVDVRENLASSFPEKSSDELRAIEKGFYENLAEYFIDAIDIAGMTEKERIRRCPWPDGNRAQVVDEVGGRAWVAMLAHFGSWEMFGTFGLYRDSSAMVSAYKPLSDPVFDLYYQWARNLPPRVNTVPSGDILRFFSAHRDGIEGRGVGIALIADQGPALDAQSRWVEFLHHPTVFFHGGEKIARKYSLPVYYMRIRKRGRGLWEQTFEMIWDGTSPTTDYGITGRYADLLEEDIRQRPELWLWSHRRWKRLPEGDDAIKYEAQYGKI